MSMESILQDIANNNYTVEQLRDIINNLSVEVPNASANAQTLLYSGSLNDIETIKLVEEIASSTMLPNGQDYIYGGSANDYLRGDAGDDVIYGGTDNDTLIGGSGADELYGGEGNDKLYGGTGNDTYMFGNGDGADTVINQDEAGHDEVLFGDAITSDNLWFKHVGNNLEVSVLGGTDKMTFTNWYTDNAAQVDEFEASNGYVLDKNNVDNLVQAMASFDPPTSANISDDEDLETALQPVLTANWVAAE